MTRTELKYLEFEQMGEEAVRNDLAAGAWLQDDARLATEWLQGKDRARNEAFQASQATTGQSAADAAWEQARIAKQALITARIALIMSAIAIAVSVILGLRPHY